MSDKKDSQYWFERLHQGNFSKEEVNKAIEFFRRKDEPDPLLETASGPGCKAMWEPQLRIYEKWIDREGMILKFLDSLADPNWPGWGFAFDTLMKQGKKIFPQLEMMIGHAIEQGDEQWEENLNDLKQEILDNES